MSAPRKRRSFPTLANDGHTSTCEEEVRSEMIVATSGLTYKFPSEEKFKILGCATNRQGKSLDAIEERMQSANKANWRDILVCRSKDVPVRIKCKRLVDYVCSVFSFGSENWSWTIQTMDRIKRWETKLMMRLFRFNRWNMSRIPYDMLQRRQEDLDTDGITLSE